MLAQAGSSSESKRLRCPHMLAVATSSPPPQKSKCEKDDTGEPWVALSGMDAAVAVIAFHPRAMNRRPSQVWLQENRRRAGVSESETMKKSSYLTTLSAKSAR